MSRYYRAVETAHVRVEATIKIVVKGRADMQSFDDMDFVHDMLGIGEYELVELINDSIEISDRETEIEDY